MAIPLAPIAVVALRYGAVAVTAYAVSRKITQSQTNQRTEDALDDVAEGFSAHRPKDREQINASARYRRVVRLRAGGPGFEINATALGRISIRKVQ